MFTKYNPNPYGARVGDCTVRAITKATGDKWETVYLHLCMYGFMLGDMPTANAVWGAYLKDKGWKRHFVPDSCPNCYTVGNFAEDHPQGTFIVCPSGHVVCVHQGQVFDSWDSSQELVVYFWSKGD